MPTRFAQRPNLPIHEGALDSTRLGLWAELLSRRYLLRIQSQRSCAVCFRQILVLKMRFIWIELILCNFFWIELILRSFWCRFQVLTVPHPLQIVLVYLGETLECEVCRLVVGEVHFPAFQPAAVLQSILPRFLLVKNHAERSHWSRK